MKQWFTCIKRHNELSTKLLGHLTMKHIITEMFSFNCHIPFPSNAHGNKSTQTLLKFLSTRQSIITHEMIPSKTY